MNSFCYLCSGKWTEPIDCKKVAASSIDGEKYYFLVTVDDRGRSASNNYINGNVVIDNGTGWVANASDDLGFVISYTEELNITIVPLNETYVKWNGSDSNVGSSWENAFRNINFGINYTNNYNTSIIHIAPGNYSNDPVINVTKLITFWCDVNGTAQNASEIWCDMPQPEP